MRATNPAHRILLELIILNTYRDSDKQHSLPYHEKYTGNAWDGPFVSKRPFVCVEWQRYFWLLALNQPLWRSPTVHSMPLIWKQASTACIDLHNISASYSVLLDTPPLMAIPCLACYNYIRLCYITLRLIPSPHPPIPFIPPHHGAPSTAKVQITVLYPSWLQTLESCRKVVGEP